MRLRRPDLRQRLPVQASAEEGRQPERLGTRYLRGTGQKRTGGTNSGFVKFRTQSIEMYMMSL